MSKMNKWTSVVLLVALVGAMLGGCAPKATPTPVPPKPTAVPTKAPPTAVPTPAPTEPPKPVTLTIGDTYLVDTINPLVGWRNWPLRELWYDSPIEWTGMTNVEPGLAESWTTSEDGKVWTFKIRKNLTFNDGSPCTAKDVAWTLNFYIETKAPTMYTFISTFQKVEALDDATLQITVDKPQATMISLALIYAWVVPSSVWEGMTPEQAMEYQDIKVTLGTGPYKVVEYVKDEYMIMEANPNYWRGKPVYDRIVYRVYPNADAVVQALLAGEVDLIGIYSGVPSTAVQTLQNTANVGLLFGLGYKVNHLVINSYENGMQSPALKDVKVRQAIAYSVDKKKIVNAAYLGYATPAISVLPPAVGDYVNPNLKDIPFDPAQGKRVLEEAGYKDSNNDGVMEDKDGKPLELRLYGLEGATSARIVEIIADGLTQTGIKPLVTMMKTDMMQALWPSHDFDLISRSWFIDPDPDFLLSLFACGSRCVSQTDCGWSDSGYCDPAFDEMYVRQGGLLDRNARRDLIWEMQEKLFEDIPYVVLFYSQDILGYRKDRFQFDQDSGNMRIRSVITHGKTMPVQ
jgi:peptide/nickel transport system substrate-binding protein